MSIFLIEALAEQVTKFAKETGKTLEVMTATIKHQHSAMALLEQKQLRLQELYEEVVAKQTTHRLSIKTNGSN